MTTVAFVGIGRMGRLMVPHLVAAGHAVRTFDLAPGAPLERAVPCASSAEAAAGADVAITMLPSPAAVRAAVLGPGGLAERLAPGSIAIDMSTSPPALARELAASLGAHGVEVLDAPVSGGTIGARAGTLVIMVGGATAVFARAEPLLAALGSSVVHVGAHGQGQAAKLCNNLLAGVNMAAIAQAVALARREGIDAKVFYDLVTASTGDSRVLRTRYPAAVNETTPAAHGFEPMFTVDLMEKDLALAEQLAGRHGIGSEPLAAALALYRRAQADGLGALDYSAVAMLTGGVGIDDQLTALRGLLGVQRATVRLDVPEAHFPVRFESRADGAASLKADTIDLAKQPVPRVLAESGGQVVQDDAAAAFPGDAAFHEMREQFGGMRAQIVTGCYRGGALVGLLSVHDLRAPRSWSDAERALCRSAASRIAEAIDAVA